MIIEWDADCVDDYGGIPEPGDIIKGPGGKERMITRVGVVNKSLVEMKVIPNKGIQHYDDPCDSSVSWEEIDEKYLNNSGSTNFLDSGLTPNE